LMVMTVNVIGGDENINSHGECKINTNERELIMNIKERIKTIIDDYSTANEEARERNKILSVLQRPIGSRRKSLDICKRPYFT